MNTVVIYRLLNRVNGKSYIGQTRRAWKRRWGAHLLRAGNPKCDYPIARAMRKYGAEAFDVSFIELCESVEQANAAEKHWIRHFNSMLPWGYNVTPGGVDQISVAPSVREKISEHNRTRVHSPESRIKRSLKAAGEGNPNRKLNAEAVIRIRELYSQGKGRPELAIQFGVTFQCIDNIVKGKTWKSHLATPAAA